MLAIHQDWQTCPETGAQFWTRHLAVNPKDGYRVRYSRFGCEPGTHGAILIAPGRTEPAYEYYETALDFVALGYGPIYAVDHRGQGLSPRLLNDPLKGHVTRFEDYVDDLETVVTAVLEDLDAAGPRPPLHYTANSLGSAIGIGYLQRVGDKAPFASAALLGAMIHVNYISFAEKAPTRFNLATFSETGALAQARWRCSIVTMWNTHRCTDYADPVNFGPFDPENRIFRADDESMLTQSRPRYDLRTALWSTFDWAEIATSEYADTEFWPGPQLGGATNAWVREGARFNRQMRQHSALEKMVHVPILMITGTRDLRAYRPFPDNTGKPPDLSRHREFCDRLNTVGLNATGRETCRFEAIEGAFHELYKERDIERNAAIALVDTFFRSHAGTE